MVFLSLGFQARPTAQTQSLGDHCLHVTTWYQGSHGPPKSSNNPYSQQSDKLSFRLLLGKCFAILAWFSMLAKLILLVFLIQHGVPSNLLKSMGIEYIHKDVSK